ncbi:MAG: HAMP domain-containing histidine kinase [Candidatus Riflebacteria bacterium]|nr:HAMP domain-containing sensor histidine kinase [uncultured Butyrivibrio sp.]MBR4328402.1 HAMP domain-containing histidine kinase [Candidatus Riflebacteria bacterium]
MTKEQKASLVTACIFYVLTVVGFFYFSVTLIVIVFLLFTLSITYFAYLCYRNHNDYTGAEHLQQEIGILKSEKETLRGDYEILIREKDEELNRRQNSIEELKNNVSLLEKEKEELERNAKMASQKAANTERADNDGLLPPDDDDDTANIDIIQVARQAIRELEEAARSVDLIITISSALDKLMVRASAKRLLIMFRNIIDNSIKYMQSAGTLVITISAVDDVIFIVLKDTGKGLPEDETKHIFELNYQGSNRISGNGLGLTQAKAIVEHYGGTIYARSPEGKGMGIYIQLPTT